MRLLSLALPGMFVFGGLLLAQSTSIQATVDATGPVRDYLNPPTSGRSGAIGSPKLPLRLELAVADARLDGDGSTEIDFMLTNTGHRSIDLPFLPNPADVEPPGSSKKYRVLRLGFILTIGDDRAGDAPGVSLLGHASVPGSIIALDPGKSMVIKGRLVMPPRLRRGDWMSLGVVAHAILTEETITVVTGHASSDSQVLGVVDSSVYHR